MFGVFCRRWGIPLMDGGTVRLRAPDRPQPRARPDPHRPRRVRRRGAADGAREPARPPGRALPEALALAHEIAKRPQAALRSDRLSSYEQWSLSLEDALAAEYRHGVRSLDSGEFLTGLDRYGAGAGRHGTVA